ncbi:MULTISPECIES: DEAD/DEAH box helicase [unclassified Actinopolyspora]|uniref:DEAD/DEAH box helicase n=1 Tax=unclassified Actinopolyspora TaxID=2639451 RepID=UPI0013F5E866|nr:MULTISPECIES: DEAD/DEAH box helicase [unclassified Actinopolyspora]NHD18838.1 DEAD/DEAH box helicase [Actinopolyspora sp. BKK2]NHE77261.1 DEAD/DEAH box helicase [Actinopolyspora sp. BKK1]
MTSNSTSEEVFERLHPIVRHHVISTLGWPDLRPLQRAAIGPVLDGTDAMLLAPTAGGKTEAAALPLLTRMAEESWEGLSVLYICPLRALLNDLQPRLDSYAHWLGRSAAVWHGDVSQPRRARILREEPDILLTTPESLEAMLVSAKVEARRFFRNLRAVVVDEIHAFAGDDRGWHLLATLERLSRLAGRPLQRIGLSATVGNPEELLKWLQGSAEQRPGRVVSGAETAPAAPPEITLDHVGNVTNAAKVIATLHRGEKRLVFVDSRRRVEELSAALRSHDVTTFASHSSLSSAQRRASEQAFAEADDCVIVATSTLELGIDVGDLDRVIQLGAPATVSSFLQRLGRTGRRANSARNCLFLCLDEDSVLHAAGLLQRWSAGWVEPVRSPPVPRHIAAQQFLALALQEHTITPDSRQRWWGELPLFDEHAERILHHLVENGFLEKDGELAFIGQRAEREFGRRYFSDLTAVFSAPPEFTVLAGREEIGTITDELLVTEQEGPRVLLLGGKNWLVNHVDWARRRCYVETTDLAGKARWTGYGAGLSFEITRGMRQVALGAEPSGVTLTRRAEQALQRLRERHSAHVTHERTVLLRDRDRTFWWTWAGTAVNRTLHANLTGIADEHQRVGNFGIRLHHELPFEQAAEAIAALDMTGLNAPDVDDKALNGLKFSTALPADLARDTLAQRHMDSSGAAAVLREPVRRTVREE